MTLHEVSRSEGTASSHPIPAGNNAVPSPCCNEEQREFCDTGYPIWVRWNRAQMLAHQHRDTTGYDQAKSEWMAHRRGR
jgi:hypothetical protein